MATMHGGLIAAAIDTTCGVIVRLRNYIIPTINLNVNYLSPGMAQDALLVTAKTDRAGQRICSVHAQCCSQKTGQLIATATANFMIAGS